MMYCIVLICLDLVRSTGNMSSIYNGYYRCSISQIRSISSLMSICLAIKMYVVTVTSRV